MSDRPVGTTSDVASITADFQRFLGTEKIQLPGLALKQLKFYYTNYYAKYKKQIDPSYRPVIFESILNALVEDGTIEVQNNVVFQGNSGRAHVLQRGSQNVVPESKDNVESAGAQSGLLFQNSKRNSSGGAMNDTSSKPRRPRTRNRRRAIGTKLAVDQHILYNKPTSEEQPIVFSAESNNSRTPVSEDAHISPEETSSSLPQFVRKMGNTYECQPCAAKCTSEQELRRHLDGRRHRLGLMSWELKSKRNLLMQDKHGIVITADCEGSNGVYCVDLQESKPRVVTLTIKNTNESDIVELAHCEMLKRIRVFNLDDEQKVTEAMGSTNLLPGTTYAVKVCAKAKNVGNYHTPIGFQFRKHNQQDFHIIKMLHARCRNSIMDQVRSSKPYKRPPRSAWRKPASSIIPGYPLQKFSGDNLEKIIPLESYYVLDSLRKIINHGLRDAKGAFTDAERLELNTMMKILDDPLEAGTYQRVFDTLVYFEEVQMEVDIRKYEMEAVVMTTCKENRRLLSLEVPGLAENRPSVLRGDHLYVRINTDGQLDDKEYQGYVHDVRQNEVLLGFSEQLMSKFVNNMKFNVRFVFNRLPLRLQHRSCSLAIEENLEQLLFPSAVSTQQAHTHQAQRQHSEIRFYNKQLENNEQQKTAIKNILSGISRPAPYIVFGPPGTGKTVTIVEAMMQIWKCQSESHILACAPSNSAADLIAQRLLKAGISKSQILRLNAASRAWAAVPDDIKEISNVNPPRSGLYCYEKKEVLMKYRVIVCTLVTAGRLSSANFDSGHFTHVFVDESGHAVEPECLIALAGILCLDKVLDDHKIGQVVLAGDPKQLGPVLRSPFAIEYGLDKSMLERLMMECEVYRPVETGHQGSIVYDNRFITKLLHNYRSHPSILEVPNMLFYDKELICSADQVMRESLCTWNELPRKNFPVIFHGIIGKDEREERSPSFFNAAEVAVVIDYVEKILNKREGYKVSPKDIGIISPYRKQVQKLQQITKQRGWKDITIGSVEEFQGQERLVMIVSTVRSNPDYLSLDLQFKLGFLKNPKRFNVTVTRAKALLIVVGNPYTLSQDTHWNKFIVYCHRNGGYKGVEFDADDEDNIITEVLERLQILGLADISMNEIDIFNSHDDKAWRADM